MLAEMSEEQRQRLFKQFGATLGAASTHMSRGLSLASTMKDLRTEADRQLYLSQIELSLHNSWQSVGKLLRRIAKEVDRDIPKGRGASRTLLLRMAERTGERPAVVGLRNLDTAHDIERFHRDFRQERSSGFDGSEIVSLLQRLNGEIVPEISNSLGVLALAAPESPVLIEHLASGGTKEKGAQPKPKTGEGQHRKAG